MSLEFNNIRVEFKDFKIPLKKLYAISRNGNYAIDVSGIQLLNFNRLFTFIYQF